MARALVVGGRGQCGRAVVQRILAQGWDVVATTSGTVPVEAELSAATWVFFKRDGKDDLAAAVDGEFDVVVDNVAYNADHADQMIRLGDRVGSAVVLSTLAVYSDEDGRSLAGATGADDFPQWPDPISPDGPTVRPGAGYEGGKAEVEARLRTTAPWPVTIIRPGAIHGPYSRHLREWYFIKRVLDRRSRVVLPYGGDKVFQPTATVNLAELVATAAIRPADRGHPRIFDAGDIDPPSVAQISEIIDGLLGWHTERITVTGPDPADNVGNNPWNVPIQVRTSMQPAIDQLGYRQPKTYRQAIEATIDWALQATRDDDWREVFPTLAGYPGDLFDYAAEDLYFSQQRPG